MTENILRGDIPFPVLVLKNSALDANIQAMAEWCRTNRFEIAPHGKTTMCPPIFRRQLDAGAWGITVATVAQAMVCIDAGCHRVLIANQVIGPANIRSLADLVRRHETLDLYCLVDSVESTDYLGRGLAEAEVPRPVNALVEIGQTGWRAGARSAAVVQEVTRRCNKYTAQIRLRGVECFEGLARNAAEAESFLQRVAETAERLLDLTDIPDPIFSAGGSSYLGPVSRIFRTLRPAWCRILRSGCYVTHDHGIYAQQQTTALAADPTLPRFTPALELWACVQSVADPGVAILSFGKRNCAYDISLPIPLEIPGSVITAVNDQHAYLSYPETVRLTVGTMLRFGISHPCTAFDKWRSILLIDDEYNVLDIYKTFF
jgi:D-serine dehydratase